MSGAPYTAVEASRLLGLTTRQLRAATMSGLLPVPDVTADTPFDVRVFTQDWVDRARARLPDREHLSELEAPATRTVLLDLLGRRVTVVRGDIMRRAMKAAERLPGK